MGPKKMFNLLTLVLLVGPSLAKKHHNPLWQWMYMRDPLNYTHSVQTASNKPNNQVDNRRQRYFDSTSYNYQQYYTHEGKLNMTNQANSTAINNWLQSYDDLTRTIVKRGTIQTAGQVSACMQIPLSTRHLPRQLAQSCTSGTTEQTASDYSKWRISSVSRSATRQSPSCLQVCVRVGSESAEKGSFQGFLPSLVQY